MASTTPRPSPAPQGESGGYGGFDAHEMVIVHRAFRREMRLLGELVAAVAPGDTARAGILAGHFADVRTGLHNHHHGEDELLWPPMLERAGGRQREIVRLMEEQHERVAATLAEVEALVARWRTTAAAADRDALVAALAAHHAVLVEHLDAEEAELLPLAERFLTAKEWAAQGEHFLTSTPKSKLLKFLGMVLEDADERERAVLLGGMPAPARLVWHVVGRPLYARTVRRVRGTT
ncbi:hemerythrin domain-containing protein [Streptomyces sp. NPDC001595]|uniref:hemerythrin domain-containing protein n=1 Tax=Streptomyces sp. NPDC001532 TaxID=3154520 RepID=UPI00331FFF95